MPLAIFRGMGRRLQSKASRSEFMSHIIQGEEGEVQDIPFVRNDMKDEAPTMDKPLDTTDAPGRADSEMIEETAGEASV